MSPSTEPSTEADLAEASSMLPVSKSPHPMVYHMHCSTAVNVQPMQTITAIGRKVDSELTRPVWTSCGAVASSQTTPMNMTNSSRMSSSVTPGCAYPAHMHRHVLVMGKDKICGVDV